MKQLSRLWITTALLLVAFLTPLQAQIERAEPLSWWTDMKLPLRIMFYGTDLANAEVTVQEGLTITKVSNAESKNYLFVDVEVERAGTYTFQFKKGRKKFKYNYTIEERRAGSANRKSFDASDVVYLIMPDRFANGDSTNDNVPNGADKANRNEFFGRHGGDIKGIMNSLDYLADLGITAIWNTPLLEDNQPKHSYHGYACTDYYHIDARFGDNELYRKLVEECHKRGIKMIMDIVTNHCGLDHWWMRDLPYRDWIHQFDTFTRAEHVFSVNFDPNASVADRELLESGWFDTSMPDMNLDNPEVLHYFKQWAIWWIEYANLDGLRVDTYPYNEKYRMAEWCAAVRTEYPNINIVGECWTTNAPQLAYWDGATKNRDGFSSNLPSIMDFPLQEAIIQAFTGDPKAWGGGMMRVYTSLSNDFLYEDPRSLMIFTGNHDIERVADMIGTDVQKNKLAITLIATLRGVPQLLYGEELMFVSKDRSQGHGGLRVNFPGGWENDAVNLFDPTQRNADQAEIFNYYKKLLNWRKSEPIIHEGKTKHFLRRDNTYTYFRYTSNGAVMVVINASESDKVVPTQNYSEMLNQYHTIGKNVLTNELVDVESEMVVKAMSALVVKLEVPK